VPTDPILRIDARYAGPPGSGNGGVTCGLLAAHVDAPAVEVTLRRPPPLEVDLRVHDGGLYDGDVLVASAVPAVVDVEPHPAVDVDTARAAGASYGGLTAHPFPGCFVCGVDEPLGLGLRPGPIAPGVVAAVWTPTSAAPFLTWAALDCPGGWTVDLPGRPMVLGRMALRSLLAPTVGEPHVVVGWTTGSEGRKTFCGTALYDGDGALLALARQTWLAVDVDQVGRQAEGSRAS